MGESPHPSAQCDFEAGAPAGDSPGGCGGRYSSYQPRLFWGSKSGSHVVCGGEGGVYLIAASVAHPDGGLRDYRRASIGGVVRNPFSDGVRGTGGGVRTHSGAMTNPRWSTLLCVA